MNMQPQDAITIFFLLLEAVGAWQLIQHRLFHDSLLQRLALWGVVFGGLAAAGHKAALGGESTGAVIGFLVLDGSWAAFCTVTVLGLYLRRETNGKIA